MKQNELFEVFWNEYDKKVGRLKAEKLWDKLSLEEQEKAIAYCKPYRKAQPQKRYRKNPDTFLRNKAWEDEIITEQSVSAPVIYPQAETASSNNLTKRERLLKMIPEANRNNKSSAYKILTEAKKNGTLDFYNIIW